MQGLPVRVERLEMSVQFLLQAAGEAGVDHDQHVLGPGVKCGRDEFGGREGRGEWPFQSSVRQAQEVL